MKKLLLFLQYTTCEYWTEREKYVICNLLNHRTIQFLVSLSEDFSISFYLLFCFALHFRSYTLYVIAAIFLTCPNKCIEVSPCPCWKTLKFNKVNHKKYSLPASMSLISDLPTSSSNRSFSSCSSRVGGSHKSTKSFKIISLNYRSTKTISAKWITYLQIRHYHQWCPLTDSFDVFAEHIQTNDEITNALARKLGWKSIY